MFALTSAQLAQLDALFKGAAVRTVRVRPKSDPKHAIAGLDGH